MQGKLELRHCLLELTAKRIQALIVWIENIVAAIHGAVAVADVS
jgi:hypothetical protein